jgi:uncharacterized protein (DUF924 family)
MCNGVHIFAGTPNGGSVYQAIVSFWFSEIDRKSWWSADPDFDELVRARFSDTLDRACRAELHSWREAPLGRLAEVLVLDQFARNIHRNTPRAFAQDPLALALAQEAISVGAAAALEPIERNFLYMPFMHSESRLIHEWAEMLFLHNGLEDNYQFELRHKAIIDRFGRYPHRNEILSRASTDEEVEFLKHPGSKF